MRGVAAVGLVAATVGLEARPSTASAPRPNAAFSVQAVIGSSLVSQPTTLATAPDGRVFVAQLNGVIKVFHGLNDTHPKTFANLSNEVYSAQGHGLLGMALDPAFPTKPYVYVLYSRDSATRGGAIVSANKDTCTTHATTGCVRFARLARLTASGDSTTGSPKALIDDWCNQYVHHIGMLRFGPGAHLSARSGGAPPKTNTATPPPDYAQSANPRPPPPPPAGTNLTAPTAQGGSLRAQDSLAGYD